MCKCLVLQTRGFEIASLNIASLPAHIDEFSLLMADKNLDVLAINETRKSDSIDNSCIHIQWKGMIIKRNHLKKKAVRSGDLNDWSEYRRVRNKRNNKLRDTKAAYYHKEIKNNSGNVREIWKTINDLMS